MQVTFIGDPRGRDADLRGKGFKPGDPEATTVFGKRFPLNMAVTVDANWFALHGAKLKGNPHFQIGAAAAPVQEPSIDERIAAAVADALAKASQTPQPQASEATAKPDAQPAVAAVEAQSQAETPAAPAAVTEQAPAPAEEADKTGFTDADFK